MTAQISNKCIQFANSPPKIITLFTENFRYAEMHEFLTEFIIKYCLYT